MASIRLERQGGHTAEPANDRRAEASNGESGAAMYPLQASRAYPREQWYVAAYRNELPAGTPLGREIFGEPVVLFRSENGEAIAVAGLCVHRFMPLAGGQVTDGKLVCPYHGYAYGADGQCVHIPTGGKPSPHAKLRQYPVIEDGPFIWVWPGMAEKAATTPLPDLRDIGLSGDGEGWRVDTAERLDLDARPALLVDNLFDLSHIAFIHLQSLPGAEGLALIPPVFDRTDVRFRVGRTLPGFVAEPDTAIARTMPRIAGRPVFVSLHTDFYSPAMINSSGPWAYELVDGDQPGAPIAKINFVHIVTPKNETATHYFNVVSRDFDLDDEDISAQLVAQTDRVRKEDAVWIAQIEKYADRLDVRKEISTKADEGALKVRRVLQALIEAEEA